MLLVWAFFEREKKNFKILTLARRCHTVNQIRNMHSQKSTCNTSLTNTTYMFQTRVLSFCPFSPVHKYIITHYKSYWPELRVSIINFCKKICKSTEESSRFPKGNKKFLPVKWVSHTIKTYNSDNFVVKKYSALNPLVAIATFLCKKYLLVNILHFQAFF